MAGPFLSMISKHLSLPISHSIVVSIEGDGLAWTVVFLERLGEQPPLTLSEDNLLSTRVDFSKLVTGRLPAFDSRFYGTAEVEVAVTAG